MLGIAVSGADGRAVIVALCAVVHHPAERLGRPVTKPAVALDADRLENHADAALVFWMPDQGRWKEDVTTSTFHWCLAGKYDAQVFPLGQCIWNGAQKDVRRIESASGGKNNEWLGLYLERIS